MTKLKSPPENLQYQNLHGHYKSLEEKFIQYNSCGIEQITCQIN